MGVAVSDAAGAELAHSRSSQTTLEESERTTRCVSMVSISVGILKSMESILRGSPYCPMLKS